MTLECSPIVISPNLRTKPPAVSNEHLVQAVERSADSWQTAARSCAQLPILVSPTTRRMANEDGINLIAFRNETWCHNDRCGHLSTFHSAAQGMTTTYPRGLKGAAVREGDIELNGVHYSWRVGSTPQVGRPSYVEPGLRTAALDEVLVHELGHVLGLPDVCLRSHSGGASTESTCNSEQRHSVMNSSAKLTAPTSYDTTALCGILSRRCHSIAKPEQPSTQEPAVNWTLFTIVLIFGGLVLVIGWRRW